MFKRYFANDKKQKIMKNILQTLALFFLVALPLCFANPVMAEDPIAPPPPGAHGQSGNQAPAGAPIDGGVGILLALGAAYGARKIYLHRKKEDQETTEETSLNE